MEIVIAIILLAFIAAVIYYTSKTKKAAENNGEFSERLKRDGFVVSKVQEAGSCALFVDDTNKQWTIKTGMNSMYKIYTYSDLLEFEVHQDGDSIAKGTAGSAILGSLLFGATGAIIGSSGKQEIKSTCTTLQLRLRVNDLNAPERRIDFITSSTEKSSFMYKNAFETAKSMAATLAYIEGNKTSLESPIN